VPLSGSLDDFSVQDILQILSLGRKTGGLFLETTRGAAAILLREGCVYAATADGAPPLPSAIDSMPAEEREAALRRRITAALLRLSLWRQGRFHFLVTAELPRIVHGRDIAPETLRSGLDVLELLLEVACRQDEEERTETPPCGVPLPVAPPAERPVLLVDDEELVRGLLARYLAEAGYQVVEAGDVESAVRRGVSLADAGIPFVVVADLRMPATAGNSFDGGFELVKRLSRLPRRPPVVIMADGAMSTLRANPRRGVSSVVRKPGLSKLDPEEFASDIRALAGRMVHEVLPRL
jgi:CheY-like chemotaxis protein